MTRVKESLLRLLVIACLALPGQPALAVENFEQAGPIHSIGQGRFTVENQEYRIAPGAKLRSFDPARRRLADFKTGDVIVFRGKVVNGVYFVDLIVYHAPLPS